MPDVEDMRSVEHENASGAAMLDLNKMSNVHPGAELAKFSGSPGRGQSTAITLPYPESVM